MGLSKRFGSSHALVGLDLQIAEGEVVGYLGPNGAGKTTTLRLLLGMLRPTAGRAEVFGIDCWNCTAEAHRRLAYVPGEASLWPSLSGSETLELLGNIAGRVDLSYKSELLDRFELDPSKKVRSYSKGNRQKVLLIGALMSRADLLLLDEPTSGLDPLMEEQFRHCVREAQDRGQTVFLSSHILGEVEALCDKVAILRSGRLVEFGELDKMRHLSAKRVAVTFRGRVPDLAQVPGVALTTVDGSRVTFQLTGNPNELIRALAKEDVLDFWSREPSLEELFLTIYGDGDGYHDEERVAAEDPGGC